MTHTFLLLTNKSIIYLEALISTFLGESGCLSGWLSIKHFSFIPFWYTWYIKGNSSKLIDALVFAAYACGIKQISAIEMESPTQNVPDVCSRISSMASRLFFP